MIARPRATSSRTNSGVMVSGILRAEGFAGMLKLDLGPLARSLSALTSEILADRDELHLRSDDSLARVVQLCCSAAIGRPARPTANARKGLESVLPGALLGMLVAQESVVFGLDVAAGILLGIAALQDPRLAQRRQAHAHIACGIGSPQGPRVS